MSEQKRFYDKSGYQELESSSTIGSSHHREIFHGSGHVPRETQSPHMQKLMDIAANPQLWYSGDSDTDTGSTRSGSSQEDLTREYSIGAQQTYGLEKLPFGPSQELLVPKKGDLDQYYDPKQSLERAYRENPGLEEALTHALDFRKKLGSKDAEKVFQAADAAYKWLDKRKEYFGSDVLKQEINSRKFQPLLTYDRFKNSGGHKDCRREFVECCERILELRYKEHPFIPEEVERRIRRNEKTTQ